jgi:hypothetical protein
VGKMKNNSARVVVAYRTLPSDPLNALVIGTQGLTDSYHDSLMSLVQDQGAQNANELAEVLAVRKFPDGSNMLSYLHSNGHLRKVPTNLVLMTPSSQQSIPLDELNQLIADQRGITIDQLAVTDGNKPNLPAKKVAENVVVEEPNYDDMTAAELRSKADALFKQAQKLRKKADQLDPPKSKTKKVVVEAE